MSVVTLRGGRRKGKRVRGTGVSIFLRGGFFTTEHPEFTDKDKAFLGQLFYAVDKFRNGNPTTQGEEK